VSPYTFNHWFLYEFSHFLSQLLDFNLYEVFFNEKKRSIFPKFQIWGRGGGEVGGKRKSIDFCNKFLGQKYKWMFKSFDFHI
jgi:hypothetical protein